MARKGDDRNPPTDDQAKQTDSDWQDPDERSGANLPAPRPRSSDQISRPTERTEILEARPVHRDEDGRRHRKRFLAVVIIVAVVAAFGLGIAAASRLPVLRSLPSAATTPKASSSSASPPNSPTPSSTATGAAQPSPSATVASSPSPSSPPAAVAVGPTPRRATAGVPLTLTPYYAVDLDSLARDWDVSYNPNQSRFDLLLWPNGHIISPGGSTADLAAVSGPVSYDTCVTATGYSRDVAPVSGAEYCVRTSENRHAFLQVTKMEGNTNQPSDVQLEVTVWG